MGLFGRNASPTLLPFHQNSKLSNGSDLPLTFLSTRRGARLCERVLILLFCLFFIGVFTATLFYLPDISSTVNKVVAREFLVPDQLPRQIKKPRKPFTILTTEKKDDDSDIRSGVIAKPQDTVSRDAETNGGLVAKRPLQPPSFSSSKDDGETQKRRQKVVQVTRFPAHPSQVQTY